MNGTNRNGSGNGVHKDAAIVNGHDPVSSDLLWDGLSPAVANALEQPLDPGLVSQRKGRAGRTYSYIEGHTVIAQANRIFGFGGWGFELAGDVTLRRIENVDPKTGEVTRIHAYSAPVRVTVPGAPPRTDVGFHTVAEESGEGHETACKGAVTDGLKRALRSFGEAFGNGLYGDQPPASLPAGNKAGGSPRPVPSNRHEETDAPSLKKKLIALGVEQGFDEEQLHAAVKGRTGKSLDELTAAELTPLVEGAAAKLRQLRQAQEQEAA